MTGTNVGDQAIYSCDQHYELIGQYNRTCLDNGNWSAEDPSCAATGNMQFRFYFNLFVGHFGHMVSRPCFIHKNRSVYFVPILTHKDVGVLARLSLCDKASFCDLSLSIVCPSFS